LIEKGKEGRLSPLHSGIDRLKQISIFKDIKDDEQALKDLFSIMSVVRYPASAHIINEGEQGSDMFILNKGRIRIEKKTLQNEPYTVVVLRDDMNVFFGEQALMDSEQRSATVVAETECECFVVKKDDFEALGNKNPLIGLYITREIVKIISKRLRKASSDIITLFSALVTEIESSD
jgi:CRP/FNR family cyclic AMP-dependent transcriptional regulator